MKVADVTEHVFEDVSVCFPFALIAFTSILTLEFIFRRGNGLFLDCLDYQGLQEPIQQESLLFGRSFVFSI